MCDSLYGQLRVVQCVPECFFQVVKLFVNASEEYGEHHLSQNDAHIAESQEIWLGERRFENI